MCTDHLHRHQRKKAHLQAHNSRRSVKEVGILDFDGSTGISTAHLGPRQWAFNPLPEPCPTYWFLVLEGPSAATASVVPGGSTHTSAASIHSRVLPQPKGTNAAELHLCLQCAAFHQDISVLVDGSSQTEEGCSGLKLCSIWTGPLPAWELYYSSSNICLHPWKMF